MQKKLKLLKKRIITAGSGVYSSYCQHMDLESSAYYIFSMSDNRCIIGFTVTRPLCHNVLYASKCHFPIKVKQVCFNNCRH